MTLAYIHHKIIASLLLLTGITCIILHSVFSKRPQDTEQQVVLPPATDLNEIRKRGQLVALTDNSSTSFYIYKGDSMGYEYELLNAFAKELGVELKMVIAKDMNHVFDLLNNSQVDIVAANLTVTKERMSEVDFSDPLMLVPQVLIQRKPAGWEGLTQGELNEKLIRHTVDLSHKNIHVTKGSPFYSRLESLSEEIGEKINIYEVPGDLNTEELIAKVSSGEIEYTIAAENVAKTNQKYYPNIDVETPISFPQKIAWAVRKNSPELKCSLNDWLAKRKDSKENLAIFTKYFKAPNKKVGRSANGKFASYEDGIISQYDDLIKVYSERIGWDWRLLSALVYQESKFSPTARSWAGANGLMQLVPQTAKHYGLDTIDATAEQSLRAGTSFIIDLDKYWKKHIKDKQERIKFVLASYNAGMGHVIDARKLAEKFGKDPNVWYDNVDLMILQKSNPVIYNDPVVKCGYCRGQEPYNYVREILSRYAYYQKMPVKKEQPKEVIAVN
ncbi:MAG TPA: transporter substrate-binding domain-containing protein [Bacteroidia bacterium]|jgi:membrane-bound lytic murein transglycosylase F